MIVRLTKKNGDIKMQWIDQIASKSLMTLIIRMFLQLRRCCTVVCQHILSIVIIRRRSNECCRKDFIGIEGRRCVLFPFHLDPVGTKIASEETQHKSLVQLVCLQFSYECLFGCNVSKCAQNFCFIKNRFGDCMTLCLSRLRDVTKQSKKMALRA